MLESQVPKVPNVRSFEVPASLQLALEQDLEKKHQFSSEEAKKISPHLIEVLREKESSLLSKKKKPAQGRVIYVAVGEHHLKLKLFSTIDQKLIYISNHAVFKRGDYGYKKSVRVGYPIEEKSDKIYCFGKYHISKFSQALSQVAGDTQIALSAINNEVKITQDLEGIPGVNSNYDFGVYEGKDEISKALLLMDYAPGVTFKAFLGCASVLDLSKYQLLLQVFRTITKVHEKKVVHNDLTPWNIMVNIAANTPRVIDWGLSYNYDQLECQSVRPGVVAWKDYYYYLGVTADYNKAEGYGTYIGFHNDVFSLGRLLLSTLIPSVLTNELSYVAEFIKGYKCFPDKDLLIEKTTIIKAKTTIIKYLLKKNFYVSIHERLKESSIESSKLIELAVNMMSPLEGFLTENEIQSLKKEYPLFKECTFKRPSLNNAIKALDEIINEKKDLESVTTNS